MSFFEILPPSVLFFALGFAAAALRSDLSVPDALAKALSLYLMMAIGLKGGIAIAQPGASAGLLPALAVGISSGKKDQRRRMAAAAAGSFRLRCRLPAAAPSPPRRPAC
jgi:hypothetical protein